MHYVSDEYWKNCFSVYTCNDVITIYSCKYSIFDFPAGLIGAKVTEKLYTGKSYIVFLVLSSIIPAIYFTAIMSVSGLLRMKGYDENFWKIYFSSFPINVVFGYFSSIFGM